MLIVDSKGIETEFDPSKLQSTLSKLTQKANIQLTTIQYNEIVEHVRKNATYLFQTKIDYQVINRFLLNALQKYQPHLTELFKTNYWNN